MGLSFTIVAFTPLARANLMYSKSNTLCKAKCQLHWAVMEARLKSKHLLGP